MAVWVAGISASCPDGRSVAFIAAQPQPLSKERNIDERKVKGKSQSRALDRLVDQVSRWSMAAALAQVGGIQGLFDLLADQFTTDDDRIKASEALVQMSMHVDTVEDHLATDSAKAGMIGLLDGRRELPIPRSAKFNVALVLAHAFGAHGDRAVDQALAGWRPKFPERLLKLKQLSNVPEKRILLREDGTL